MTAIPKKFAYLLRPDMPLVIQEAIKLYGIYEIKGPKHNPKIMNMATVLGIGNIYTADEIAWCALFANYVLKMANKSSNLKSWELLRARSLATYGVAVKDPGLGDVLIYERGGSGHVNFYVGETTHNYVGIGGNQSDQVNIVEIPKTRLVAARRPLYLNKPITVRPVSLETSGHISKNEA